MIVREEGRWIEIDARETAHHRMLGETVKEVAGPEAKALLRKMDEGAPWVKDLFERCETVARDRGYILTILRRRCRFEGWYHKALNRLCQSSAADQMKRAMLDLWRRGVCALLTIHDELIFNANSEEDVRPSVEIMEAAIELLVPSIVDVNLGRTLGDVKK